MKQEDLDQDTTLSQFCLLSLGAITGAESIGIVYVSIEL